MPRSKQTSEDTFRAYLALKLTVGLQEPKGYKYTQAAPCSVCRPVCVPARWRVCGPLQQHDVNRLLSTQWPLSQGAECREVQTATWRAQTTQAENKQRDLGAGGGRCVPTCCRMSYRRGVWTGWCRAGLLEPPADSLAKTRFTVNEYTIQKNCSLCHLNICVYIYIYNKEQRNKDWM